MGVCVCVCERERERVKEVHKKLVLSCPSLPLEGKNY